MNANHRRDCLESWLKLLPRLERAIIDGDIDELHALLELRSELLKLLQTLPSDLDSPGDSRAIETLAARIKEQEEGALAALKQELVTLSGEIKQTRRSRHAAGSIRDLGSDSRQGRLIDGYQ